MYGKSQIKVTKRHKDNPRKKQTERIKESIRKERTKEKNIYKEVNMKIDFDSLPMKYWDIKTRIEYLQRRIIVYSIIYYELNNSIISDRDYDIISKQLTVLQNENKEEAKKSHYWYVFKDFDGSTGFNLYYDLNKLDKEHSMMIAHMVLNQYLKSLKEGKVK